MPVRARITFLFVLSAFILLGIVCGSIYYFSYRSRVNSIKKRLTNRAITTGRLLGKRESFNRRLIRQLDSLTAVALKEKVMQAYDDQNNLVYRYSDLPGDCLPVNSQIFRAARVKRNLYFRQGDKDVVVYFYADRDHSAVVLSAANDEDGKANLVRLRNILISSFILGIMIALIVGYFFSKRLLSPIKKITNDVSEISVQNLARRVSTGRVQDEWYALANTFNELLDKLQEGFEIQSRFISNASHELSTPLTSISSQLEVILQERRKPEDYERVMQSVYSDVRHISKLTQTLLEFAGASRSKAGLEINLLRMDEIVLNLPGEMLKLNNNYSASVDFEQLPENEEQLLVFGNEALLTAALKNVVSNACKYSPDHHANIRMRAEARDIIIEVLDRGIGIPQNEIDHIFEPFYRVEENKTASSGFGLGLSIAYRIIKLHKGGISVASCKGQGTTFTIAIPYASNLKSHLTSI